MEIMIGVVGRLKRGPLEDLVHLYEKRLVWKCRTYEVEAKSSLKGPALKAEEGRLLWEGVPKGAHVVALEETGASLSSLQLAETFEKWQGSGKSTFVFLIGGADGHGASLLEKVDFRLSLGPLTWPHKIARLLLVEQLYRVQQILQGHPYHRD